MPSSPATRRYVVFLGAINVANRRVTMPELRRIFEAAGYADVETFIASGNVILSAAANDDRALEDAIAAHLEESLGFTVFATVRTIAELLAVQAFDGFPPLDDDAGTATVYVSFARDPWPASTADALQALETPTDSLMVSGREFYWRSLKTLSTSPIKPHQLAKALGTPNTNRNMNTVQRIVAKYGPA